MSLRCLSNRNTLIRRRIRFIRKQKDPLQYLAAPQLSSTPFSWFRLKIVLTKWLEVYRSERKGAHGQASWIHWINNKCVSQKMELCIPRTHCRRIACNTLRSEWADEFLINSSSFHLFSNQPYWQYWTQITSNIGARTLFWFLHEGYISVA